MEKINLEISLTLKVRLIESAKKERISVDKYIEKILIKKLKKI